MEAEVNIRCRKSDLSVVESVIQEAADEYKALVKKEVKGFKNKEVEVRLVLDTTRFLPEFLEKSVTQTDSCMGGVLLHTRKGRIVCSNTLDERLQLVYQEAIP